MNRTDAQEDAVLPVADPPSRDPLTPIPLTILTGFLGSGKTTRLNQWLKSAELADCLVIINEFGEIGLDHLLIEDRREDVVLLPAGCLCCALRGDLVASLEDLLRRRDNRRMPFFTSVVLETSGLADPLPIAQTLLQHPYLSKRFTIQAIVSVLDAKAGAANLANHPEARRQVAMADALILSKLDEAGPAERAASEAAARALNPAAPIILENEAPLLAASAQARFLPKTGEEAAWHAWLGRNAGEAPQTHSGQIESFAFLADSPIPEAKLGVFLTAMRVLHGPRLLRMKGLLCIAEDPERPRVIQQVQSFSAPPIILPVWPSRDRRSRLVFIVEGISRDSIEGFWRALIAGAV